MLCGLSWLIFYWSIGANSCDWYGDEFECFMLIPTFITFPVAMMLSFATALNLFRVKRRDDSDAN